MHDKSGSETEASSVAKEKSGMPGAGFTKKDLRPSLSGFKTDADQDGFNPPIDSSPYCNVD